MMGVRGFWLSGEQRNAMRLALDIAYGVMGGGRETSDRLISDRKAPIQRKGPH